MSDSGFDGDILRELLPYNLGPRETFVARAAANAALNAFLSRQPAPSPSPQVAVAAQVPRAEIKQGARALHVSAMECRKKGLESLAVVEERDANRIDAWLSSAAAPSEASEAEEMECTDGYMLATAACSSAQPSAPTSEASEEVEEAMRNLDEILTDMEGPQPFTVALIRDAIATLRRHVGGGK